MLIYYESYDTISHHGVKGQKWGVRRFQKQNGTLTLSGKNRYSDSSGTNTGQKKKMSTAKKVAIGVGVAAGTAAAAYAIHKLGSKKIKDVSEKAVEAKKVVDDLKFEMPKVEVKQTPIARTNVARTAVNRTPANRTNVSRTNYNWADAQKANRDLLNEVLSRY